MDPDALEFLRMLDEIECEARRLLALLQADGAPAYRLESPETAIGQAEGWRRRVIAGDWPHGHARLGMSGAIDHLPDPGPASDPLRAAIHRLEGWWIENGPRLGKPPDD